MALGKKTALNAGSHAVALDTRQHHHTRRFLIRRKRESQKWTAGSLYKERYTGIRFGAQQPIDAKANTGFTIGMENNVKTGDTQ